MNKEEKTVSMSESLRRMADVDPATVDRSTLVDIKDVHIRMDLDKRERILDYIRQIKNPYCYLDNGVVIKISFSGKKRMEDILMDSIF